jgi:signal transduction histidine kinase
LNVAESRPANVDEIHTMMRQSVMKLDETLKEIIDYSNNARSEIANSEIHWREIIEKSMEKLQYLQFADRVKLVVDDAEAQFPFYSDPQRLGMIFNSLFSNCILFCALDKQAMIYTRISVAYDVVTITVNDNGIGISESCLPNVFNMFYRASERSSGAGLGLYITKETVKKLGGNIKIESVEHQGTTVTIEIPKKPGDTSGFEGEHTDSDALNS